MIHAGNVTQINYVMKAKPEKLRFLEGGSESFGDVLGMIDDYEGELTFWSRDEESSDISSELPLSCWFWSLHIVNCRHFKNQAKSSLSRS